MHMQLKDEDSGEFWITWVLATIIGLALGLIIGTAIVNVVWYNSLLAPSTNFLLIFVSDNFIRSLLVIVGLSVGASTGLMEWLVLKSYMLKRSWWWIITSMTIWGVFPIIENTVMENVLKSDFQIRGVLTGTILGIAQWYFMRKVFQKVSWWILARGVSGPFVFHLIRFESGVTIIGLIAGAITGFFLMGLLKQPIVLNNLGEVAKLQNQSAK